MSPLRLGDVAVDEHRRLFEPPPMQVVSGAHWGDCITLLGYNLSVVPLADGGQIQALLFWRSDRSVGTDYVVFVHLLGPNDSMATQHDGPTAGGERLTSSWQPGEVIADRHTLSFDALPAADYHLIVGLYAPATGQRLAVVSEGGTVLGDNLTLDAFRVNSAQR